MSDTDRTAGFELTTYHDTPCLVDPAGGVWWPNEEAVADILAADEVCRMDVALECEREGLGTWVD